MACREERGDDTRMSSRRRRLKRKGVSARELIVKAIQRKLIRQDLQNCKVLGVLSKSKKKLRERNGVTS
jgi:hypothetical protein